VPHDRIVATIDEALLQLADLTRAGGRKHPLLMSGPSRTADIERVLTIGVHGPRSLVAVIVDSPVR
jgi:L-lactate dehydrogenase complex protein LldG